MLFDRPSKEVWGQSLGEAENGGGNAAGRGKPLKRLAGRLDTKRAADVSFLSMWACFSR